MTNSFYPFANSVRNILIRFALQALYMNMLFNYVATPSEDFERAVQFYSAITNGLLTKPENGSFPMAYFGDNKNTAVHLFQLPHFKASTAGAIVYINLSDDLNEILAKIETAGGKVVMPKAPIVPGKGYWALFLDSEGNKLPLHSSKWLLYSSKVYHVFL